VVVAVLAVGAGFVLRGSFQKPTGDGGKATPDAGTAGSSKSSSTGFLPDDRADGRLDADPPLQPDTKTPQTQPASTSSQPRTPAARNAGQLTDRLVRAMAAKNRKEADDVLAKLVALGDAGVDRLTGLLKYDKNDNVRKLAAQGLATIGTPRAARALLDALAMLPEGGLKDDVARVAATISNPDCADVFLGAIVANEDRVILRCAEEALGSMADAKIVAKMAAQYESSATDDEKARLIAAIRAVKNAAATQELVKLAGKKGEAPEKPLEKAAVDALSGMGSPESTAYLLQRLSAAPETETSYLSNAIGRIGTEDALPTLRSAAGGSRDAATPVTRAAAISALSNFTDDQTLNLLTSIANNEKNEVVRNAAKNALTSVQRKLGTTE